MLDMLRAPATLFFSDDHIAIIQPTTQESYEFYAPIIKTSSWTRSSGKDFTNVYIVRTNSKEYFEVTKSASNLGGGVFTFGESSYLDSHVGKDEFGTHRTYDRSIKEYLKKYPSLYDAFGPMAKQMAFLPLILKQMDDDILKAMKASIMNLKYIENLTHKRKLQILKRWPSCIKEIGQTQELCDFIVKENGANLSLIDEHFRKQKLCERAVSDYAHALAYVPNQTEKICLIAIKRDAMALKYVRNPTMRMFVTAVNRSPEAWTLIKKEKLRKEVRKAKKQKKYQT